MTLLFKSNDYTIVDHGNYVHKLYENISNENQTASYSLRPWIFSIISEKDNRKRNYDDRDFSEETQQIKNVFNTLQKDLASDNQLKIITKCNPLITTDVRSLSKHIIESSVFNHMGINGGNNSNIALKCKIKDEYFLIPPQCRFYCGCVKELCGELDGKKFDIVVADPPWWNKYIRRLKNANDKLSYSMMYNEDIASIPIKNLLSENSLVAVWCTNSPSNNLAVKELIFPKWGVEYIATWYWLKVTVNLEPVCSFGTGSRKQPYERLILGKVGNIKNVADGHVIISVPSALHSHKPPLLELLSTYTDKENPQTLELFARYLLPHTTSIGYEPLKWQHISLYDSDD